MVVNKGSDTSHVLHRYNLHDCILCKVHLLKVIMHGFHDATSELHLKHSACIHVRDIHVQVDACLSPCIITEAYVALPEMSSAV